MNRTATLDRLDRIEKLRREGIVTKKQLKEYINKHGSFYRMNVNVWSREDAMKNAPADFDMSLMAQVPEDPDVFIFTGIASTSDLNRNGYKIDPAAWESEIPQYMTNPRVLLMHNMDNPIGTTLKAGVTERGLEVMGYVYDDYDMTKNGIRRALYTALSTGHITHEVMFENSKDGRRLTEDQFREMIDAMRKKLSWEQLMTAMNDWILVVTKLDWLEYSFVSIPSNKTSLVDSTKHMLNFIQLTPPSMEKPESKTGVDMAIAEANVSKKKDESEGDGEEDTEKSTDSEKGSDDDTSNGDDKSADASEKSDETSGAKSDGEKSDDSDGEGDEDEEKPEGENKVPVSATELADLKHDNEVVTAALERMSGKKTKVQAKTTDKVDAYALLTDTVGKLGQLFIQMYSTLQARNKTLESRIVAIESVPRVKRAIQLSDNAKAAAGTKTNEADKKALNEDAKNLLKMQGINV